MAERGTSKAEVVEYAGNRYRRYPQSRHRHHQQYFYATEPRRGFLHRHLWEDQVGPIPPGWDIHHKDGDGGNNALDNLECLPIADHRGAHARVRGQAPKQLEHLARIRADAAAWHASPEGVAWHRKHGRKSWAGRTTSTVVCVCCGAEIATYFPNRTRFCDQACRARFVRRGPDDPERGLQPYGPRKFGLLRRGSSSS